MHVILANAVGRCSTSKVNLSDDGKSGSIAFDVQCMIVPTSLVYDIVPETKQPPIEISLHESQKMISHLRYS
jgi:hypothetical protein